ncbi:MAG: IS110 family transposase [Desulfotomaculales bacterium]
MLIGKVARTPGPRGLWFNPSEGGQVAYNPIFVGIDVGLEKNTVQILDLHGSSLTRFKVSNDLPGKEELVERLPATASQVGATSVRIGMEATNLY